MISTLKKFWFIPVGIVLGVLLSLATCHRPTPTPPASVVEIAAQRAAGAIVQTEHADTALARHAHSSVSVVSHTKKAAQVRVTVDSLKHADAPPAQVIAAQDTVIAVQDSAITTLTQDNTQLATTLSTTRDTLATYRTPIIPATASKAHSSLLHAAASALLPTVGYGVVYDGHNVTTGPAATIGLHLTSGTVGITAGVSVAYVSGLHMGVGVTVGVRL